jgi:hypothetical protein
VSNVDFKSQIERVLRQAIWSGEHWVARPDLFARMGWVHGRDRLELTLRGLELSGAIRTSRLDGRRRPKYALCTPGEFELLLTQIGVANRYGFAALTSVGAEETIP